MLVVERQVPKKQLKRKIKVWSITSQENHISNLNLGKKSDAKEKEKAEKSDDAGQPTTPSQQHQLSSATPTNFVRPIAFSHV